MEVSKKSDRLKVLHKVRKWNITRKQAEVELGISVRWVRTLVKWLLLSCGEAELSNSR